MTDDFTQKRLSFVCYMQKRQPGRAASSKLFRFSLNPFTGIFTVLAEATLKANLLIFCSKPPELLLIDVEMPLLDGGRRLNF